MGVDPQREDDVERCGLEAARRRRVLKATSNTLAATGGDGANPAHRPTRSGRVPASSTPYRRRSRALARGDRSVGLGMSLATL